MKTLHIVSLIMAFNLLSFVVSAQNPNAERPVSKDVQKFANANFLRNENLLTVASVGYPAWTISKEIQLSVNHLDRNLIPGNLISEGYPVWIISKGVHRKAATFKKQPEKPFIKNVIAGLKKNDDK